MPEPDVTVDIPVTARFLGRLNRQAREGLENRFADRVARTRHEVDLRFDGLADLPFQDREAIRSAFADGISAGVSPTSGGPTVPGGGATLSAAGEPSGASTPGTLNLDAVGRLIRSRFSSATAGDTLYGIYLALAGTSVPALHYLDAGGQVRSVPIAARFTGAALWFPEGTYTLVARPGGPARIMRGDRQFTELENPNNSDLTITFAVLSAPATAAAPAAVSYRYYPRLRVMRSSGEQNLTVGAQARYDADVEIWQLAGDTWTKVRLSAIYAFIRYRWTVYRLFRDPAGAETSRIILARADPGSVQFTYTWEEEGEHEIECVAHLDYEDASPRPITGSTADAVSRIELRAALDLAMLELQDVRSGQSGQRPIWPSSAESLLAETRGALRVAEWTRNEAAADNLRKRIHDLEHQLVGQTSAGPFPIRAIFTERRSGQSRPISLFVGPTLTNDDGQPHTWLLIDLTFPTAYHTYRGSGENPAAAIRAAFERGKHSIYNNYPPGRILARIEWPGMDRFGIKPFDFPIDTESTERDAHEWWNTLVTVGSVVGLAATALLPETWVLVPQLVVLASAAGGLVLTAAEIKERLETNSFEWDRHAALDLLNVVASVSLVAGSGVRVLAKGVPVALGRLAATGLTFANGMLFVGAAADVSNALVLSYDLYRQLVEADAELAAQPLADYRAIYGKEEGSRRWSEEWLARMVGILARAAAQIVLLVVASKAGKKKSDDGRWFPKLNAVAEPPAPHPQSPRVLPEPPPIRRTFIPERPPLTPAQQAERARVRDSVVGELTELHNESAFGNKLSQREFLGLMRQLRRNRDAGTNRELIPLLIRVFKALRDPKIFGEVMAEIWVEAQHIGGPDKYVKAIIALSERAGARVETLGPAQSFLPEPFFLKIVTGGFRWLDRSAAFGSSEHGAVTHLIQDLVVDRALRGTGMRAEKFRELLAGATGDGNKIIGNDLWVGLYDSLNYDGLNRPEKLWPALNVPFEGKLP